MSAGDCDRSSGARSSASTLDCREVFLRIDDYVDRTLSAEEVEQVRQHLEECTPCAEEHGFTTSMIGEIKAKLRRIRCPESLRARIGEIVADEG